MAGAPKSPLHPGKAPLHPGKTTLHPGKTTLHPGKITLHPGKTTLTFYSYITITRHSDHPTSSMTQYECGYVSDEEELNRLNVEHYEEKNSELFQKLCPFAGGQDNEEQKGNDSDETTLGNDSEETTLGNDTGKPNNVTHLTGVESDKVETRSIVGLWTASFCIKLKGKDMYERFGDSCDTFHRGDRVMKCMDQCDGEEMLEGQLKDNKGQPQMWEPPCMFHELTDKCAKELRRQIAAVDPALNTDQISKTSFRLIEERKGSIILTLHIRGLDASLLLNEVVPRLEGIIKADPPILHPAIDRDYPLSLMTFCHVDTETHETEVVDVEDETHDKKRREKRLWGILYDKKTNQKAWEYLNGRGYDKLEDLCRLGTDDFDCLMSEEALPKKNHRKLLDEYFWKYGAAVGEQRVAKMRRIEGCSERFL